MSVKITLVLPKDLYVELERRAAEERRSIRELVIDAILQYLSSRGRGRGSLDLILTPIEGGEPEDFREYEYEDVGG